MEFLRLKKKVVKVIKELVTDKPSKNETIVETTAPKS